VPKGASSDMTELNSMFTVGRDATWVEGGQEDVGGRDATVCLRL
jgi:hypothetical protein